jgi:DNA-binding helix-hairpin-helix protein with protein kinase domain
MSGGVLPSELLHCRAAASEPPKSRRCKAARHAGHEQMSEVRLLLRSPHCWQPQGAAEGSGGKMTYGMQNMSSDVWRFVASSPRLLTAAVAPKAQTVST